MLSLLWPKPTIIVTSKSKGRQLLFQNITLHKCQSRIMASCKGVKPSPKVYRGKRDTLILENMLLLESLQMHIIIDAKHLIKLNIHS